jgi:hypothetical protein
MERFDGTDHTWKITQMEHYFSIHGIMNDMMKLQVRAFHLDWEQWQWWQWHKKPYGGYISWSQFVKAIYAHFDRYPRYLGRLTKLHYIDTIEEFITYLSNWESGKNI